MEALRSDYTDPIKKIIENINFLLSNINNHTTQENVVTCIVAMKELQDFTENLDFAHGYNYDYFLSTNIFIICFITP